MHWKHGAEMAREIIILITCLAVVTTAFLGGTYAIAYGLVWAIGQVAP
jgi:hypothetical protein